jgi:hypothetical protein
MATDTEWKAWAKAQTAATQDGRVTITDTYIEYLLDG